MSSTRTHCVRSGAIAVLAVLSLQTASAAHSSHPLHRHAAAHNQKNSARTAPPPAIPPTQNGPGGQQEALVSGLPASWRAKVLDISPGEAKPHSPEIPQQAKPGTVPTSSVREQDQTRTLSGMPNSPPEMVDHILLPIPPQIGIAAFESGDRFLIVVDNAFPMDTQAIHGTGFFSSLTVNLLPDATVIQLHRPDTRRLYLSQQANGWILGDKPPAGIPDGHVINPLPVTDGILYPLRRSGRVLSLADPASGARLLIGTSLLDEGGILAMRHADGYDVWPTLEGVVIAAHDPDVSLVTVSSGLLLNRDGQKFVDDGQAVYANDVDLRWLDLQDLPNQDLLKRYRKNLLRAADSQPADRFGVRLALARTALNMGAFREARGILSIALRDDPEEIGRPEVRFLITATELLAGSPENASALNGPWPQQQQRALQLWRALYLEALDQSNEQSLHRLALDMNRLRAYPANLRDILMPLAAEAIARRGRVADLPVLDNLPDQPAYQFTRALAARRLGQKDHAYDVLKMLSNSRDVIIAEKAAEEKTRIDQERGTLTTEQEVRALDDLVLDARLAGREKQLRLRQAEAYIQDKQWQKAADIIDQGVPESGPSHYTTLRHTLLLQALTGIASQDSTTLDRSRQIRNAALLKAHIPALPPGEERAALLAAYGETMLSLGLPGDAVKALSQAVPFLVSPPARAAAGASLAQAALAEQQPSLAASALSETENPEIPAVLQARRTLLKARIAFANGDRSTGLALLKTSSLPEARLLSAQDHENRNEWMAATAELQRLAEETIQPDGSLEKDKQDLALRLASDATRAGNDAALRWISELVGTRSLDDRHARLFSLLRQSHLQGGAIHQNDTIR
ncbi:ATP-binding protein [Asaia prunellae]|uniref:hypothetical protein n=1 Tax=Asaia prunellae TaxID=610245 RepID=UPI0011DDEB6F|nr:hypothetical protein [Asaia prunellae]